MSGARSNGARVTLATVGLFHYAELAAGLHADGQLTRLYTGYPRFKLRAGLPRERVQTHPWLLVPYTVAIRTMPNAVRLTRTLAHWAQEDLDRHVALTLPDTDV